MIQNLCSQLLLAVDSCLASVISRSLQEAVYFNGTPSSLPSAVHVTLAIHYTVASMVTCIPYYLRIVIPLSFKLWSSGTVHGLAFWFDVAFIGGQ